jgi:hypothetical protein
MSKNIWVSDKMHEQLTELQQERERELDRQVTFREIIEEWRDVWAEVTK